MKREQYGLTGEGFTVEEAEKLLEGYQPPEMTKEQREEYLATMAQFAERVGAEHAEAAADHEQTDAAPSGEDAPQPPSVPLLPIALAPTDTPR